MVETYSGVQQSLDLATYISALPEQIKREVFSSPWTSQALFRALAPLAQQYILRLLYIDDPIPKDAVWLWVQPKAEKAHQSAVTQLERLSVLISPEAVQLNPVFKACLRAAFSGRGWQTEHGTANVSLSTPSIEHITQQASKQWQNILLYLLDCEEQLALPGGMASMPLSIQALLQAAGLVIVHGRRHEFTADGFRYLLKGTNEQVWVLLREYIKTAEQASGKELASTLSFLMQLSFRRVWQPYPLADLTPHEQEIASHMAQLGLVHTFVQDGAGYFCVTPLASSLCGGSSSSAAAAGPAGIDNAHNAAYIIVETNFRVYAHTSDPLQRRVLSRLMRTDCLLPNLYVGTLTREVFLDALELGITAADVTTFLQQHAHPQVARRMPAVPENVQEQLVLWETETRRVVSEAATLYNKFEDDELFLASSTHAQSLGLMLWVDNITRSFAIKRLGHEAMRGFIVEYKAQRARNQL